eukprot:1973959-Prymnesium_polylepis.1
MERYLAASSKRERPAPTSERSCAPASEDLSSFPVGSAGVRTSGWSGDGRGGWGGGSGGGRGGERSDGGRRCSGSNNHDDNGEKCRPGTKWRSKQIERITRLGSRP